MRPSRGLNWTAGWVRLSLNATQSQLHHQQRCRSLPLSLRHSIRSSMCVAHLLHVTTFSLSLSLDVFLSALLAIALSCERSSQSRSIAMAVALAPVCAGFKIFGKYHFPIPVFPSQVLAVRSVSVSLLLFAVLLLLRLPLHLQASQVWRSHFRSLIATFFTVIATPALLQRRCQLWVCVKFLLNFCHKRL